MMATSMGSDDRKGKDSTDESEGMPRHEPSFIADGAHKVVAASHIS
jgi:hypothetical protein